MLVNLNEIKQFYFKSSKTQYNTPIVSFISLEFMLITHKKSNSLASYLLQQYLHYAPVQVRKGSCKKTQRNPHVHWSLIFEALQGGEEAKADIHHRAVRSTARSSHRSRTARVSDTRFTLLWRAS